MTINRGGTICVTTSVVHLWQWWKRDARTELRCDEARAIVSMHVDAAIDVTVAGSRVAALYEEAGAWWIATSTLALDVVARIAAPPQSRRVAITSTCTFAASDGEVFALRAPHDVIARDPLDIAASADALAVLADDGLTMFDRDGRDPRRLRLRATAIARDHVAPGWLLALRDGELVHVGDDGETRELAGGVAHATKVRRARDAIYVEAGTRPAGARTVLELSDRGRVALDVDGDWDAGPAGLFVDDRGSVRGYFLTTPCSWCGGRVRERYERSVVEPDGTSRPIVRRDCIACGRVAEDDGG